MATTRALKSLILSGLLAMTALQNINAMEAGTTSDGIRYISGGVGNTDQESLQAQRKEYSFWLTTATRQSGNYLTGVVVRIADLRTKKVVLEHTMDGPWLYASLPPGHYQVTASYQADSITAGQTAAKTIRIGNGHLTRQMFLYFSGES